MKKSKIIGILFTVVVCALTIALLVGCDTGDANYKYDYIVTFDYNVDNLGVPTSCETEYLGVDDGRKIVEPGAFGTSAFPKYTVPDYYNEGWYTAVLDNEGNPTKDADGNIVLDKKWDFKTDVVHSNMTLYANFLKNPVLRIIVEGGTDLLVSREPGMVYNKPVVSSSKPQKPGFTFIDYYTDATYTTKLEFPYTFTDHDDECYALMLEGDWTTVTNTDTFLNALTTKNNMYFDVASGQIDFTNRLLDGYIGQGYNGTIYGNGCVVKNMKVDVTFNRGISNYSLFGNLGSKTLIKDITFENITFNMTVNVLVNSELKASLFATDIESGAKFENVTFKNCALNYLGQCNYEIETYGYYVSSQMSYDCFDETQLTVTNSVVVIKKED